eukprot:CAMPEP_0184675690 /NCGR_PEP_ID=MMETSP0308-20130426/87906_1 /TAXON_ID=38269 /ORGANISM="Gloeochaete witrockiana, Strain SAG 46.84" /LENGTH=162 /DNA_ID=CAMNT_0027123425 /DNA_START=87 /DNA_END=575 /DNA_ORIENTATION=-
MAADGDDARQPFFRRPYEPAQDMPMPSLVAKDLSVKLRKTLLGLLILDVCYYTFGSFLLSSFSAVDLFLLFLGYYGQDLLRPNALHLYCILTSVSIVVDVGSTISTGVMLGSFFVADFGRMSWIICVMVILFFMESAMKVVSMTYANRLRTHLIVLPGQSVV